VGVGRGLIAMKSWCKYFGVVREGVQIAGNRGKR